MIDISNHFSSIDLEVKKAFEVAGAARSCGFDPVNKVEVPIATSLAEKSVGLISVIYPQLGDPKIVNRILELEKQYGPLEMSVALKIAEEIAKEEFCKFESLLQAIDAGIRVGFAYVTLGVVSSPLEGFTGLKLGKTLDGKDYFKAYFSGPIRSAGTTAGCVVLMIIDYLREFFGFAKYDPTDDEVRRYVTENYDYHERVNNLQYLPTEEEIVFLSRHIPIQIVGEPTEDREVSNYKDLPRIETNFIRGGMCLIFSEGLAQKAQKGLRLLRKAQERGFKATGWDFLDEYVVLHKKREKGSTDSSPTYIKDLVAGRPVFGHPSRSGSFRFRYGLSRANGFSATAISPATMAITDSFISFGTQLKIEKPTKGCAVSSCDGIDGPIVKLNDGSVVYVDSFELGKKLYPSVNEIIYLGDILVTLGDVINRNYELIKPGYVEEWWALELVKSFGADLPELNPYNVSFQEALSFSEKYKVPLHPRFIFYWSQISFDDFCALTDWLVRASLSSGKIVLPYGSNDRERFSKGKRALELVGCPHTVYLDNLIIAEPYANAFLLNLGISSEPSNFQVNLENLISNLSGLAGQDMLSIVNKFSKVIIKDKAGTFIGARMGRPEKAKLRKLPGNPHVLFPVGEEGGRLRSFQEALGSGVVNSQFPLYFCNSCNLDCVYPRCHRCGANTSTRRHCPKCNEFFQGDCPEHGPCLEYKEQSLPISEYFEKARVISGLRRDEVPMIKGVRGTSNKDHRCEPLVKGFLRAKYNLNVNKDGTIRYDFTEMPLTYFKPLEVRTSFEKLRELGYLEDVDGRPLERDDQVLALMPHDIVLASCPDSDDERADDVFLRVSKFIDEELEKLYGLSGFYNLNKKEDLVGHLCVCIAPHICTATVGRIIGFSKTQSLLASPFMHAAMRRDCDGDEAAVMLLLDMLINFSRCYLPAHRGGTQDAPLVLNTKISAGEVDDQILDFELGKYPLELYQMAEQGKHSSEIKIDNVKGRLKSGVSPFLNSSFTCPTSDINHGVLNSSYKKLPSMEEKVGSMMNLCNKLRSVDVQDVARLVIERHFIRDTRGNLRKFSMQVFRCVGCNEKFRRPPLAGKCSKCGGKLIFTISEGSIVKYLASALNLARTYKVSPYLLESLEIVEKDIEGIFGKESEKQEQLRKWF